MSANTGCQNGSNPKVEVSALSPEHRQADQGGDDWSVTGFANFGRSEHIRLPGAVSGPSSINSGFETAVAIATSCSTAKWASGNATMNVEGSENSNASNS
jgi:hypothetical protein